jgi:hypothetical protein
VLDLTLESNRLKLFEEQLKEVLQHYPNLTIKEKNGLKYLKGIIDIKNETAEVVGSFLIEVHFVKGFPFRFPKLYEVGGLIPNIPDWHKYSDDSCCITVEPDEKLKCRHGITVLEFIKIHAIAFLANYIYRKIEGKYKNGEYSHGEPGLIEFYTDLLKTSDKELWLKYYKYAFKNEKFKDARNKPCLCGNEMKFKKCHLLIFDELRFIGEGQVLKDFSIIIK